jgi:alkylhydroperoxidase family enzyme
MARSRRATSVGDEDLVLQVKRDFENAPVSDKLKALLAIAGQVQRGGKHVTAEDVERARQCGATDLEIHDTVLIAAAFCMYNRYVDGLATWAPPDPQGYRERAAVVARDGYLRAPLGLSVPTAEASAVTPGR